MQTARDSGRWLAALAPVIVIFAFAVTLTASPAWANSKYASIVIEAETGQVVHQSNADTRLHPASLTKIMTLYVTFDALKRGDIRLSDPVPVSRHAASMPASHLALPVGDSITVEDAIMALVTRSANDIAAALGEKLAGTEWDFGIMMTERARELGMVNTTFRNASGLHHASQLSTARDMATLGRRMFRDHPEFYPYFSRRSFTYRGVTHPNHNRLLSSYQGMDGIKTGYIRAAGFNLVASAERNGTRLIAVVFGGRSAATRNEHMAGLLDRGFDRVGSVLMANRAPLPPRKPASAGIQLADRLEPPVDRTEVVSADPDPYREAEAAGSADDSVDLRLHSSNSASHPSRWSIQVGAYSNREASLYAIRQAAMTIPELLSSKPYDVMPVTTDNGDLYRARLLDLGQVEAADACQFLSQKGVNCITVAPN